MFCQRALLLTSMLLVDVAKDCGWEAETVHVAGLRKGSSRRCKQEEGHWLYHTGSSRDFAKDPVEVKEQASSRLEPQAYRM